MHSMTGYGRGVREADGRALTIELKSVNHRFLDLSLRMPRNLSFLEKEIRHIIGGRLARGHIDVFVTYSNHRSDAKRVEVDMALLQAYSDALGSMKAFGFPDDISLMSLARMPDVLIVTEAEEDREAVIALMQDALGQALDELSAMRSSEGARLADDLENHAAAIDGLTKAIEARYPETVDEHTARLRSAIEELAGRDLDETRLLTEIAIIADRSAIDEETVRLHSHVEELRRLIRSEEPVGRRLDFLVQELNREANTITSKSQDVPITRMAVEMKAEIEKMREQLQNVE